ncbi:DUF4328 domain-containing protein [Novosphingobium sp.]|uniref:DUF4328 domain-containing protein n=1 Tax=Novosphingobium sp. TaxID=1874826 RepID=UPI0026320E85|nr:DUF4328 domain-containing protein [Novosphingobium sp.]
MNDEGLQTLRTQARILRVLLPAFAAVQLLFQLAEAAGLLLLSETPVTGMEMAAGIIGIAFVALFIACIIFTAMWLSRANTNLREAGREMVISQRGTWGWYFVPIANLFKPYAAMSEFWNESLRTDGSFGSLDHSLLRTWWGCWIVGNILSNVTTRLEAMGTSSVFQALNWIASATVIAAALLLLRIVREVTIAQANLGAASVFD